MDNSKLKDLVKNLKAKTAKIAEGDYEEKPEKVVEPVVETVLEPEVEEVVETPVVEEVVEETTPIVSAPVEEEIAEPVEEEVEDTPSDDIDAKIAEYYRRKQAKIEELEKAEQEEALKIIKKTDLYEEKKKEYADIFNGIMISRDDLDKENIGRAVLDEFTLKDTDTEEDMIEAGILDTESTMGMDMSQEDKVDVVTEMAAGETDGIDEYIVDAQVSGGDMTEYVIAGEKEEVEPEAKEEIASVIEEAKKTTKKTTTKSTTAKKTTAKKTTTTKKTTTKKAEADGEKKTTAKKSTTKKTATKATTKKSTTTRKTTKKDKEVVDTGITLSDAEMESLVNQIVPEEGVELTSAEKETLVENIVATDENTESVEKELAEGWSVDDYNKLVGIKDEEPVEVESEEEVSKDGTLDSNVALNESDIEYLEKEEDTKSEYFYGSEEHKENEESKKSETPATVSNEVELGDKNFNKDIANATPSSEIKPMSEPVQMTEEERFAKEMEYIYTIFGVEEKARQVNLNPRRILYVATECQPFAATGGLADVAGSLPNAIAEMGVDIRVIMPLYGAIKDIYRQDFEFLGNFTVHLSWRREYCGLFRYYKDGVTYYFIDNERYFKRDNLYGYFDDGERFAYFCRAVVESLPHIDFFPDIIHCNDWQSALVPTYIKTGNWTDHRYYQIKHIYTIHNVEYQGVYGMENLKDLFGIDECYTHDMEYDGTINLTKAAIQLSDKITTVSHSYCDNLKQPYCSRGLHHIICRNEHKLTGIINGIDNNFYNPATDQTIHDNFDIDNMEGKKKNKKAWQEELGLPVDPDTPMLSMVTRLVSHKGLDLMVKILEDLLQDDIQFVIVGTGDQRFIEFFRYLEDKYPTKVRALVDKFSLEYARKNYAGSDIFIMPSKIEPCGISQMVSSRYGTVPIVRECGGLKDTITDFGCEGGGNGYTFTHYNSEDLKYQIKRAISDYHDKDGWAEKMRIVMTQDFSWAKSAKEYIDLYESIMK